MSGVFSTQDRQNAFDYILSITKECKKIIALVQVGSGAIGYHDDRSDLDFLIELESIDSMTEVMEYMHCKISELFNLASFTQSEHRRLQRYVLSNLLEIDIGYGGYENAAAWKPAFKVLYDRSCTVEKRMTESRKKMDDRIYGFKQKKDIASACETAWMRLMHAAVAIRRGNLFRFIGELEPVRNLYIDLLGDRYRLESNYNREIDRLPENEKEAIRSTFVTGESPADLWTSLLNLTKLVYQELEGHRIPVTQEMLYDYYKDLRI